MTIQARLVTPGAPRAARRPARLPRRADLYRALTDLNQAFSKNGASTSVKAPGTVGAGDPVEALGA